MKYKIKIQWYPNTPICCSYVICDSATGLSKQEKSRADNILSYARGNTYLLGRGCRDKQLVKAKMMMM